MKLPIVLVVSDARSKVSPNSGEGSRDRILFARIGTIESHLFHEPHLWSTQIDVYHTRCLTVSDRECNGLALSRGRNLLPAAAVVRNSKVLVPDNKAMVGLDAEGR